MFKKIMLMACMISLTTYGEHIYYPSDYTEHELGPDQVIFAFDVHHVLAQPSYSEMLWQLTSFKGFELAGKMALYKLFGIQTDVAAKFKEGKGRSSEGLAACFQDDPEMQITLMNLGNTYNAMPGMTSVVEKLKALHYDLIIASDIGPAMFERTRCKEDGMLPGTESLNGLLSLFDKAQVVSYNGDEQFDETAHINIVPNQKPSSEFFIKFNQRFNTSGSKVIIFVDDRIDNITAATQQGWIGIHFTDVHQLQDCLAALDILN